MNSLKQELLGVLDELSNDKIKILWYFAQFLKETDELSLDEITALNKGIEQFEKGEFVAFDGIRRG